MFGLWISVDDFCRGWLGESEGWTPLVGLEWWGGRSGFVTVDPSVRRLRRPVDRVMLLCRAAISAIITS